MQNFFNKIGKTASEAASKAGSKASELMEIGKLKGKITTKKQYIGNTKKDIGAYCYELFEAGDIKDPRIEELCEQIKAYSEEIEALEAEIEEVKEKYRVKNDEDDPAAENRLQDPIWGRTGFDGGVETGEASRSLSSLR